MHFVPCASGQLLEYNPQGRRGWLTRCAVAPPSDPYCLSPMHAECHLSVADSRVLLVLA